MGSVVNPVYSPVCDVDLVAYKSYLASYSEYVVLVSSMVGGKCGVGFELGGRECQFLEGDGGQGERVGEFGEGLASVCQRSLVRTVFGSGERGTGDGFVTGGMVAEEVSQGDCSVGSGRADGRLRFDVCSDKYTVMSSKREDVTEAVCEERVGDFVSVLGGTKKKRGKNQRDREKRGKGVLPSRGVADGNWRKGTSSGFGSVPVVGETLVQSAVVEKLDDPVVLGKSGVFAAEVKSRARESLEKKWEVENRVAIARAELAEEKAKKDLEFQRARDVEAEIRRSRTLVMKQTESNKVATEKAFATLRATGNVPGFCETVVSGGGSVPGLSDGSSAEDCMISPDSSASMHEFREAQKRILDLEDKIRKMERAEKMRATVGEVAITNDGDEPTPSLQEEMDRQDEKYNTQYVYEPAAIGGKNVLLLRCETFGDYCEGEDY